MGLYWNIEVKHKVYTIGIYEPGDPILPNDGFIGCDCETELIKCKYEAPPLVLAGFCSGQNVQLVPWRHIHEYMPRLLEDKKVIFGFFNGGFDSEVIGFEEYFRELYHTDRVIEIKENYAIMKLAKTGWYNPGCTLDSITWELQHIQLEKDDAIRLTFKRDQSPSPRHMHYMAMDAISTYLNLISVRGQPTEFMQARSAVVLHRISRRGMLVDRNYLRDRIREKRLALQEANEALQAIGVYMDSADRTYTGLEILERFGELAELQDIKQRLPPEHTKFNKQFWRFFAAYMYESAQDGVFAMQNCLRTCLMMARDVDKLPEAHAAHLTEQLEFWCTQHNCFDAFNKAKASTPWKHFVWIIIEEMMALNKDTPWQERFWARFERLHEENMGWLTKSEPKKTGQILQEHLTELELRTPPKAETGDKLIFERTKKTKKLKVSSKDAWLLEDFGVNDPMLERWFDYKHIEKLLSTYLTEKYIDTDGRVHPRFTNMVRTGRTACSSPNLQNPAKEVGVRECYIPAPGKVLCSIDYSQLELCGIAQICLKRYGFSKMAEKINAGIHLHRWFAAKRLHMVSESDYDGTKESVDKINAILETIDKKTLKLPKAGNFGFPGGMGTKTFYRNCRENDIQTTLKECDDLRVDWTDAWPEMELYLNPVKIGTKKLSEFSEKKQSIIVEEERDELDDLLDDEVDEDTLVDVYEMCTLTGRWRRNCTYSSALNGPFQGTSADAVKEALWLLDMAGVYLVNFIHDEVLFESDMDKFREDCKLVDRLMVEGAMKIMPDIQMKTEPAVMLRWAKDAGPVYDDNGDLQIWYPKEKATA